MLADARPARLFRWWRAGCVQDQDGDQARVGDEDAGRIKLLWTASSGRTLDKESA